MPEMRFIIGKYIAAFGWLGLGLCSSLGADAPTSEVTLQQLLTVQRSVQMRLPALRTSLVALESADGAATGVIVSASGLVLTAAHVTTEPQKRPQPGRRLKVLLNDGRVVMATSLGMDVATDAAMLQLDGTGVAWPYATLHRDADVEPGEWCFALGHPGGYDAARGEVLRVGKVLKASANSLQTDCVLMGGDSGGPLFNLKGELIGIHSQIWEGRDQNVHVSIAPFLRSWDLMAASQVVREWNMGAGGWLGVATLETADGKLAISDVAPDSPAARSGLLAGDIVVSMDHKEVHSQAQFSETIQSRPAGDSITLITRSPKGERVLNIKLAQRPNDQ
jgi:serine protease Do